MEKECKDVSAKLPPLIMSILENHPGVVIDPKDSGIESSKESSQDTAYGSYSAKRPSQDVSDPGYETGKTDSAAGVQESIDRSSYCSIADKLEQGYEKMFFSTLHGVHDTQ